MPDKVEKPFKLDEAVIQKLEYAFSMDCSVNEAALFANISSNSVRNWMESFPELKERFEQLRNKPILKARTTVVNSLDDPEMALKYLERKNKAEFAPRAELTAAEGMPLGYVYTSDVKPIEESNVKQLPEENE